MDTLSAFAMGEANRGRERMVFDWDKAARLIKEAGAQSAAAGLSGDWEHTGGPILEDGKPVDDSETYTFLASTWATPELVIDDGDPIPCYVMEGETKWNEDTYWPQSALAILND